MFNKYDKYYIIYSSLIILYLILRYLIDTINIRYDYNIIDMLVLYSIPIFFWYLIFCHRNFVMTKSRLEKYYKFDELEYCTYEYDNARKYRKIYVRVNNIYEDSDWYELDYDLTIPKNSYLTSYTDFITKNNTVEKLLITMSKNYEKRYELKELNYKYFRNISLLFILGMIIFHMIICLNI